MRHPDRLAALAALACCLGCAEREQKAHMPAPAEADVMAACVSPLRMADGSCCPAGHFYDPMSAACTPIGPRACRQMALDALDDCLPRWCWDGRDDAGDACALPAVACHPVGRRCTDDEVVASMGCAAGTWPDGPGSDCVTAGAETLPAATPPVTPLPVLAETRFCADAEGARLCEESEAGCGPGAMPATAGAAGCVDVGVPWLCPPGFLVDPGDAAPGALPGCLPDPADCGTSTYPSVPSGGPVVYVQKGAKAGGDGSLASPFTSVGLAIAAAPAGATVAIAAGAYSENLVLAKPVRLIGRCAAQVSIAPAVSEPVVRVVGKRSGGEVELVGLRLTGSASGLIADDGPSVRLQRSAISGATGFGLRVRGTHVTLSDLLIDHTRADGIGDAGIGLFLLAGATVNLSDVRLHDNRSVAVVAVGSDSELVASGLLVDGTREHLLFGAEGLGMAIQEGASATLSASRISGNLKTGVVVEGGARLVAHGLVVDGTLANSDGYLGIGISATSGANVTLRGVRVSGNRTRGLDISGPDTRVDARGLVVDGTREQVADASLGTGLHVTNRAIATLRSLRLSDNRGIGLAASITGTDVKATDLLVDGTRPSISAEEPGLGVALFAGATVTLLRARVTDSRGAGVAVIGSSSALRATDLLVEGSRAATPYWPGQGLVIAAGAMAGLTRARIIDNRASGVFVVNPDSHLGARALQVDATRETPGAGGLGVGVLVSNGASARIGGGRLHDNRLFGLMAYDPGTRAVITGLLVDGNRPASSSGLGGGGAVAGSGASLTVTGCEIRDNRYIGVAFHRAGSPATVIGTVIGDTFPGTPQGTAKLGEYGTAVTALSCASGVDVVACRLVGNHAAAAAFTDTDARLSDTVAADNAVAAFTIADANATGGQTSVELADGFVVKGKLDLDVADCLVQRMPRAGLLADGPVTGTLSGTLITTSHFGVVAQGGAALATAGSALWQNATNLAGDSGLFVPAAPHVLVE